MEKYWHTSKDLELSEEEVNRIVEKLWKEELQSLTKSCYDCGVKPGEPHIPGCDVARCTECGMQELSCEHEAPMEVWTGLWPGVKECYEQKLICWSNPERIGGTGWTFDLNTLHKKKAGLVV